jgi:hypothetical protein
MTKSIEKATLEELNSLYGTSLVGDVRDCLDQMLRVQSRPIRVTAPLYNTDPVLYQLELCHPSEGYYLGSKFSATVIKKNMLERNPLMACYGQRFIIAVIQYFVMCKRPGKAPPPASSRERVISAKSVSTAVLSLGLDYHGLWQVYAAPLFNSASIHVYEGTLTKLIDIIECNHLDAFAPLGKTQGYIRLLTVTKL